MTNWNNYLVKRRVPQKVLEKCGMTKKSIKCKLSCTERGGVKECGMNLRSADKEWVKECGMKLRCAKRGGWLRSVV
jgi:hypothetical protein